MSLETPPEMELMRRASQGDQSAMESLLMSHYDRIVLYVSRRIGRHFQGLMCPEDIVQDVCVLAIRHARTFQPQHPESFHRWLNAITRNHLLEVIRMQQAMKRDRARDVSFGTDSPTLDAFAIPDGKTPSKSAVRREAIAALIALMGRLKPEYKRVLQLRFLEGLSLNQVAQAMGKSVPAVQMLNHRALAELKQGLGSRSRYL